MEQKRKYKIKYIYIFIYLFAVISCKNDSKRPNLVNNNTERIDTSLVSKKKHINVEYILLDSILINNKLPYKGKIGILKEMIKKPDSISYFGYECGSELNEKNQILYYKESEVEVSKKLYVFRSIEFSLLNISLNYKNIVFNKNYSIDSFKKDFPKSFLNNKEIMNEETIFFVSSIPSEDFDASWRFTFIFGKLTKLYYFIPC